MLSRLQASLRSSKMEKRAFQNFRAEKAQFGAGLLTPHSRMPRYCRHAADGHRNPPPDIPRSDSRALSVGTPT